MDKTRAEYLRIEKLHPFEGHPFKVADNEEMDQLGESILAQGVLTPLVVRPLDNGEYEVITAAVNKGKSIIAKSETTVKEIIDSRNEIINAIPAYVSLSIYTYIDSVQNILDAFDSGEITAYMAANICLEFISILAVQKKEREAKK